MSELQDKLNSILSDPEALRQVQSLGEQLGLNNHKNTEPPKMPAKPPDNIMNDDMLTAVTRIAPLMKSIKGDDNTTRLLNSLRPFLSDERQEKLDKAEKMIRLLKIMPLLRDNGLF